jgi:hypothetical protein
LVNRCSEHVIFESERICHGKGIAHVAFLPVHEQNAVPTVLHVALPQLFQKLGNETLSWQQQAGCKIAFPDFQIAWIVLDVAAPEMFSACASNGERLGTPRGRRL